MYLLTKIRTFPISARRADFLSYAFLILLPLLFFWRETLGLFTLGAADVLFWFYPIWKLAVEQVKSGHLPLWNPYNYGGTPLFAQWQPGLLDPLNWIHLLGPSSRTLTMAQQLCFSIALLGMFCFTRRLGMARRAAVVSAVIYALSGHAVARTIYPGMLHIYVLVPFVFLFVERLYQRGRWRDVVFGGLIVAWQIFAGHAQLILYSSLLAAAYALFCAFFRRDQGNPARLRFLALYALMFLIGITLSAVQLMPAWEVANQSERQRIPYEIFVMNSLHPISLLTTIFPFFHGGGKTVYQLAFWGDYWTHNEAQIYLGVLALSLALSVTWCFWRERSRIILFWSIVPIVASLLAFGKHLGPISWIIYQVPLLNLFRSSCRHWMEVVFAVAVLAGYAVDRILRGEGKAVVRIAKFVMAALTLLSAAVGICILWRRDRAESVLRGLSDMGFLSQGFLQQAGAEFYLPIFSSAFLLIVFLVFARSSRPGRWYLLLLCALIIDFNLYAAFAPINRPGVLESGEFASPIGKSIPPEIAARQSERGPIRYHLMLNPGPIAFNPYWFYGHEMATGYDPVINTRYSTFSSIDEVGRSTRPTLLDAQDRTLDLLNVKYVLIPRRILSAPVNRSIEDKSRWREVAVQKYDPSDYDSLVYENLKALPRVWLVNRVELKSDQQQLQLIRGELGEERVFDPLETALIDPTDSARVDQQLLNPADDKVLGEAVDSVDIVQRESSRTIIDAEVTRPSLLVMSEGSFPGWRARVDGRAVGLLRVDYLLRGVGLSAGKHRVEIFYWPRSLKVGGLISGLTLAFMTTLMIWERWREGRKGEDRV